MFELTVNWFAFCFQLFVKVSLYFIERAPLKRDAFKEKPGFHYLAMPEIEGI